MSVEKNHRLMGMDGSISEKTWANRGAFQLTKDTPTKNDLVRNTSVLANFTQSATNNSTIAESTAVTAKQETVNTITLSAPVNNPAGICSITESGLSVQFDNDNAVPTLFSYYLDKIPNGVNLQLYPWISNSAALGSANRCRGVFPVGIDSMGWTTIAIDKRIASWDTYSPHWEQQGTAAFNFANPMVSWRAQLSGDATIDSKLARVYQLSEGKRERPKVVITFDDSKPTAYSIGYKQAKKRNLTTSHFAIFDSLSTNPGDHTGMTLAQIREIAADPLCYVGLHSNARFDGAGTGSGTTPTGEMTRNINGLKALSLSDCKYVAWPEGQYGQATGPSLVTDVAKSLGILGGRTTLPPYQWFNGGLYNPYAIKSYGLKTGLTLAQAKEAIDRCIEWGCAVVFYAHDFGAAADGTTWITQDYIDLLDYIALKRSLGLIDDMRFDDFMEYGKSL